MIIARGAEAVIEKKKNILKQRIAKGYRHPILDEKIRKQRTKQEAKLLDKTNKIIPTPELIKIDEKKKILEISYISGKKLSEHLDKMKNKKTIAKKIGQNLAKIHDAGIIHGDLTTSNIIYNKKVYFIDFGLGYHSDKPEDKAVDLHLIKEAFEAKHHKYSEELFKKVLEGYKSSKNSKMIIQRLEKVEQRGRYKQQY